MPPIEFCLAVPSRRAAPSVWTHLIIAGADLGADASVRIALKSLRRF